MSSTGEDESSDIRIPVHGAGLKLRHEMDGSLTVQPYFSVYIRVLPTWDDLRNEVLGLRPKPRLTPYFMLFPLICANARATRTRTRIPAMNVTLWIAGRAIPWERDGAKAAGRDCCRKARVRIAGGDLPNLVIRLRRRECD